MQTMKKMPRELTIGDVIVELDETGRVKYNRHTGKPMSTKITKVEHYACSKRDTHINNGACYPWSIPVDVAV